LTVGYDHIALDVRDKKDLVMLASFVIRKHALQLSLSVVIFVVSDGA